ncbi:methyltransferase domain-containing protein [Mobilitalea sibirica]|uniref:Methyltransferase domain-containing protein n=1 Tax=Mobilitalea sibirica TaxID=1462919 RepID=A0A8J7H0D6_9FIRM|nr:rRNA adenine N-6-methyltransferase family protein [Mobilitalea sibirica]MBH1939508.1 methyltransferase domain-containing protein [Mobilitalea sibirica]
MSIKDRLRIRIKEEGICMTIKYLICVCLNCIRECIYEILIDLCISRKLLRGNCKTIYKHLGANDVYHTKYSVMPIIFRFVPVARNDVLVDVGCGKGRVINYWISRRLKNQIVGLELDERVAKCTKDQLSRYKNITIIAGDAIANLPQEGTIFYFYNPFTEDKVKQFEETMSAKFNKKPITIIYYNPKSVHVFENGNWRIRYINFEKDLGLKKWGRINKYHDLAIIKNIVTHIER